MLWADPNLPHSRSPTWHNFGGPYNHCIQHKARYMKSITPYHTKMKNSKGEPGTGICVLNRVRILKCKYWRNEATVRIEGDSDE